MKFLHNVSSGLRTAVGLPVRADEFHASLSQALLGVSTVIAVTSAIVHQRVGMPPMVNVFGILSQVTLLAILLCCAIAFARRSLHRLPDLLTAWSFTALLPAAVLATTADVTRAYIGGPGASVLSIVIVFWATAVLVRGAAIVAPESRIESRSLLFGVLLVSGVALGYAQMYPMTFLYIDTAAWADYDDETDVWDLDTEGVYYRQPELLDQALAGVPPGEDGVPELYFVGFAGDGEQQVFEKEARFAASVIDNRYESGPRSVVLANDFGSVWETPLANSHNLYRALRVIGGRMNPGEDVLFLFLTSHGSADATVDVSLLPFDMKPVDADGLRDALDDAGITWRIIVVSACYSGSFIEALEDTHTLVLTAAAADRRSFGCANHRELTYFGEAFFRDALPTGSGLLASFDTAIGAIDQREHDESRTPSNPQVFVGEAMRQRLEALGW